MMSWSSVAGSLLVTRRLRSRSATGTATPPLTTAEPLPWRCRLLIVGTGVEGLLPVAPEVIEEARRRGVELLMLPTAEACARLSAADVHETAAVLHVTC